MTSSRPPAEQDNRGYPLDQARRARGWTESDMARYVRERGRKLGVNLGTRRDGVWRWARGRTPDRPTQMVIADLLGIPSDTVHERPWPDWLLEDPVQRDEPQPWTLPGAARALKHVTGGAVDHTRRDFVLISGATLTASLLGWLTADPVAAGQITTGSRIGEATLARIEQRVRLLRAADDQDGGGSVLIEASSALTLVEYLLDNRSYSSEHGARLYAAAADLARQRAAALLDVRGICADGVFEDALHAAHAAGDTALGANVLGFWALSAYNTGKFNDAQTLADTALASVRGRTTPKVEAMLTSRRGRARAHRGDLRCWADFDRAEELLADSAGHDDPDWVNWIDEAEILGARASSHRDLHQPDRAADAFARADALGDPAHVRTRALYLARRADAQLDQHETEQACATASEALELTESISSRRTAAPLLAVARRLKSDPTPAARDFREHAAAVLAA